MATSKDFVNRSPPSSSEEGKLLKKKSKKKSYAQKYIFSWEQIPEFKGRLQPSKKGPSYAHCKCCNKDFICGKSEIEKQSKGKNHTIKVKNLFSQQSLTAMPDESTDRGTVKHLALVARVFHENNIQDYFLGLIPVPATTAQALYDEIT
ncbi:hypothetical protein CBL_20284, partial [Carabus blaptoides fortunei]